MTAEAFKVPGLHVEGSVLNAPRGQTSERPVSPKSGAIFVNEELNSIDVYNNGSWIVIGRTGLTIAPVQTASGSLEIGKVYPVDTSSGQITLILPTIRANGDRVMIFDVAGKFSTNRLDLSSANNINGSPGAYPLSKNFGYAEMLWHDAVGWIDVAAGGKAGIIDRWYSLNTDVAHYLWSNRGYLVDTTAVATQMEINLPDDISEVSTGDKLVLIDAKNNFKNKSILLKRGNAILNFGTDDLEIKDNGASIELTAFIDGTTINWITTAGSVAGGKGGALGDWSQDEINGTGGVLEPGQSYFVNTGTQAATATMPDNPQRGDTVWIIDKARSFDSNSLTLQPAQPAHEIEGMAGNYVVNKRGSALMLTWSGTNSPGWVVSSSSNLYKNSSYVQLPASGTATPDFTRDIKTIEYTVTGNLSILNPDVQLEEAVSFFIVLKMDNAGGHVVTLPGELDGWLLAQGSSSIDSSPGGRTVIQGLKLGAVIYYSITRY